jgi:hypothetical protein
MPARLVRTCAILVGLGIAASVRAGVEGDVAPPEDVTQQIKAMLPKDWSCQIEKTTLVVRPNKTVVFVNMLSADPPRKGEASDHYRRRHQVKFDYRIALRFVPKLTAGEVRCLVATNATIQAKRHAIEHDPLAKRGKASFWFAETAEGRALSEQYDELERSLKPVPFGHREVVSVYIEPTFLGSATFLDRADEAESAAVLNNLRALFTRYDVDGPNKRP